MAKKKTIILDSETFIIENKTISMDFYACFKTLDMCYDNPSRVKEDIYDYWCDWFKSMGCANDDYGVVSYNCMQFSMGGLITLDNEVYYAYITKCYNRLYKVGDMRPCMIDAQGNRTYLD